MEKSLSNKIMSASLWSLLGSSSYQILGLITFIILSRLLTPSDFGVVAIAIAIVEIANVITRMGMVELLVKDKNLNDQARSSVFWFNAAIGLSFTLLIYSIAPWFELLFNADGLAVVLRALAILPTIYAFTTVYEADLKRQFLFKKITIRIVMVTTISGLLAIALALNDFGLYSLVFMRLSTTIVEMILYMKMTKWLPKFSFDINYIKKALAYTSGITFAALTGVVTNKFIEFVIAILAGTAALGYYKIAAKLIDFVVQITISPFVAVALPAFSSVYPDFQKIKKIYISFIRVTTLISLPAFYGLAVIAPYAIEVFFGNEWSGSAVVLQVTSFAGFSYALNYFFSPLMASIGKPWLIVGLRSMQLVFLAIVLYSFNITSIESILWVYVGCMFFMTIAIMAITGLFLKISAYEFMKILTVSLFPSCLMSAVVFYLSSIMFFTGGPILTLSSLIMSGVLVYGLVLVTFIKLGFVNVGTILSVIKNKEDT